MFPIKTLFSFYDTILLEQCSHDYEENKITIFNLYVMCENTKRKFDTNQINGNSRVVYPLRRLESFYVLKVHGDLRARFYNL